MTKAFAGIKQGLNEAIAHAKSKGKTTGIKVHQPQAVDVSGLGQRLGLTRTQFAARFGFSVATLRHWERGDWRTQRGAGGLAALKSQSYRRNALHNQCAQIF